MKSSKIKVAVVGYGYWGPNIVRNFLKNSDCIVNTIVDNDQSKLILAKNNYPNINTTQNIQQVLDDSSIDCIAICTPVHTHYNLVKLALESKKHVLVEKPLTDAFKTSKNLIELAKKVNRILIVDNTYLYTPAVQKISKIIKSNSFGEIQYLDSTRINLGKFQNDINVLWDLATHDISICLYLIDELPISVQAIGKSHIENGLEDISYLTLHFKSNMIAHFNCSWISPVKIRHMLIGGTKQMIVFNDLESTEKLKIYNSSNQKKSNAILTDYRIGDVFIPKLEMTEGLSNLVSDFVSAIKYNKKPISSNDLSLTIVKILECAQKSIKNNGKLIKL
jgi:predicted dehydrogenase